MSAQQDPAHVAGAAADGNTMTEVAKSTVEPEGDGDLATICATAFERRPTATR